MVRIITDSCADFEPAELAAKRITCVPLSIHFGEKEFVENVTLTKTQYFELLKTEKEFPKTAQPSPQTFAALIKEAGESGEGVVIITISSGLSGTYQGAVLAKTMAEYDDCYVIDSLTGTGEERLLVEHACRMRDEGKNAKEIAEVLEEMRHRIVLYTCMDTLEYLHRGGRISHTAFTIGSLTHIKPIMHMDKQGRPEIPAKMLGMRKAMDYILRKIPENPMDPAHPMTVMYTADRSNGEKLAERIRTELGIDVPDDRIVPVGAAVGTHIGPNACAIVYVAKGPEQTAS